jgi:hypothetical protein
VIVSTPIFARDTVAVEIKSQALRVAVVVDRAPQTFVDDVV